MFAVNGNQTAESYGSADSVCVCADASAVRNHRHGAQDAVGTAAHNAHSRERQTSQTGIHSRCGQVLCTGNHIISQNTFCTEGIQCSADGKPCAFCTFCGKSAVHVNHILHKGDFFRRDCFYIIHEIRYGHRIERKRLFRFRCLCFRFKNHFIVFPNLCDVAVFCFDEGFACAFVCFHFCQNVDFFFGFVYGSGYVNAHTFHAVCVGFCDRFQTFQSQCPVTADSPQQGSHFAAQFLCAGDGAGKCVFIHAAVHFHVDFLDIPFSRRCRSCRCQCNGTYFCDTQSGADFLFQ